MGSQKTLGKQSIINRLCGCCPNNVWSLPWWYSCASQVGFSGLKPEFCAMSVITDLYYPEAPLNMFHPFHAGGFTLSLSFSLTRAWTEQTFIWNVLLKLYFRKPATIQNDMSILGKQGKQGDRWHWFIVDSYFT